MRNKVLSINWRYILYTGATLSALALAAGARWRPK